MDLKQVGTFVPLLRFKIEHGERGSDLVGVFFAALLFYRVRRMHNFVIKKICLKKWHKEAGPENQSETLIFWASIRDCQT